jgi:hypothetical protein
MPVVLSQIHYHRDKHGEGFLFVGLQDVQEIVIFKEAHSSISHLQMNTANTFHDTLEKSRDQVLDAINLTDLQHFLELCQKESLLYAVSKGPILE